MKKKRITVIDKAIYNFLKKEETSEYIGLETKKGMISYLVEQHKISPGKKHMCYEVHKYLIGNGYIIEKDPDEAMLAVCGLRKAARTDLTRIIEGRPTAGYCLKDSCLSNEMILRIINDYPHLRESAKK